MYARRGRSGRAAWTFPAASPAWPEGGVCSVTGTSSALETSTPDEPVSPDRHRLELRCLVATLATTFINIPPEQVDSALCETLEAVGTFAGADRAVLVLLDDDGQRWTISHEWSRQGLAPLGDEAQGIRATPWTLSELAAGRPIRIRAHVRHDPEPARHEHEVVQRLGLRSVFIIPVFTDGKLVGAAGIGALEGTTTEWTDELSALLQLPASMMVDALSRRASELARRANETLWRSLCDCDVISVFILDRDGRLVDCNDTGLRIAGRTRDEMASGSVSWTKVTPREYRPLDLRALERIDRGLRIAPWEKELQRPDGSRVPVLATLASLAPFAPELLALSIDLSERERAQKELRRSNRFDHLLATLAQRLISLPAPVIDRAIRDALAEVGTFFGLDRVGLYETLGNSDVEQLRLSWLADPCGAVPPTAIRVELAKLPWWRERLRSGRSIYVPVLDDLPSEASAERAMLEGNGVKGFLAMPLYTGRVSRGAVHFAAMHPLDISDQHLALLRVLCDILANARERKRAEDEIRIAGDTLERRVHQRRAQLEASNAELEAFAYSVSHDLRAPLRAIDGLSEILLEDFAAALGDEGRSLIVRMRQANARMSDLIDGLLQLSRVVRTEVVWKPVNLSALVAEAAEDQQACEPDRRVVLDIEPGVVVRGHEGLLRIAIVQLMDNAWKFSARRDEAHISFGVEDGGGERTCFLRDDGVGFDSELADKLFGAFQRLHGVSEFEGHGIGLATVERIIRIHGGKAWAKGNVDSGTVVYFTLGEAGRSAAS